MTRINPGACFALLGALLASACGQTAQSTAAAGEQGSISASDQAASNSVRVAAIGMPSTGWVVLHAVADGNPVLPASIGHVYVPAGPSTNVDVPLSVPVEPGGQVMAMLHLDTGNPKVYEFGNGGREAHDPPVLRDGKPVATVITLR